MNSMVAWARSYKALYMTRIIFFTSMIFFGGVFFLASAVSAASVYDLCVAGDGGTEACKDRVCQGQPFSGPANPDACKMKCGTREWKWRGDGWAPGGPSEFRCCCLSAAGGTATSRRSTVAISCPTGLVCLGNPLGLTNLDADIPTLIGRALRGMFAIIGTIALIIFIYGGALWMTAFGEESKVKRGWDTMIWGAIGLVVIFGSYIAVDFILKAILGS